MSVRDHFTDTAIYNDQVIEDFRTKTRGNWTFQNRLKYCRKLFKETMCHCQQEPHDGLSNPGD